MDKLTSKKVGKLILSIPKGNSKAIEEIYLLNAKAMYSVASKYLRQPADIEDAVHTALEKIVVNARSYCKDVNACAWVNTIVRNTAIDMIRRTKREVPLEYETEPSYEMSEDAIFVQEAMGVLSENEQALVELVFWNQLSYTEVQGKTGKPRTTAKYQVDKAIEKMKDFYKK